MKTSIFSPLAAVFAAYFMMAPGPVLSQVPGPVTIQGLAENSAGQALTGTRAWRVRFYSDGTGTTQLGSDLSGSTTLSDRGRFSFSLIPPTSALAAVDLHYDIAIDGNTPPNGISSADLFPGLVRVTSVPFARRAEDSTMLGGLAASAYAPAAARAYSVVVDDDGPADFSTIQAAITSGAKTIFVRDGNYIVSGVVDIPAAPFTMIGESRDGVVINMADNGSIRFVGDTGLPFKEGTVTSVHNTTTVTAETGAPNWLDNAAPGEIIRVGRTYHEILTVDSNAQLTLRQRAYGPSQFGVSYSIANYGTGFHFENLSFRDTRRTSVIGDQEKTFAAICLRYAREITVRNCRAFKQTSAASSSCGTLVYLENCYNALITECRTREAGLVSAASTSNITIANNEVYGGDSFTTSAIAVYGLSNDEPISTIIISGNRINGVRTGFSQSAIHIAYVDTTGIPYRGDYIITGNYISNCFQVATVNSQAGAIQVWNAVTGTGVIANNIIRGNAGSGIAFVGSSFVGQSITGNVITGNTGYGITGNLSIGHASRLITGNMMEGNALGGVGRNDGDGTIGTAYGTMNVPKFESLVP